MNWPILLFVLALVALAAAWWDRRVSLYITLSAVVVYLGVHFNILGLFRYLYLALIIIALMVWVIRRPMLLRDSETLKLIELASAFTALVIATLAAVWSHGDVLRIPRLLFWILLMGFVVLLFTRRFVLMIPLIAALLWFAFDKHVDNWVTVLVLLFLIIAFIAALISSGAGFGWGMAALALVLLAITFGNVSFVETFDKYIGCHAGLNVNRCGVDEPGTTQPTTTTSTSTSSTTTSVTCPNSWAVARADNANNRWFADGVASIRTARTEQEAKKAAEEWLGKVKTDPVLLSGAVSYLLKQQVDPASLVNGNCMSSDAVAKTKALELALTDARIKPEAAPANGTNSGVNAGQVVVSATPGISGDRAAVKVELKDGTTIWILARCGNPVSKTPPPVPKGPTDEKKPTPTTTTVVTTTTTCSSGKCNPPTTVSPPPTTAVPPSTTTVRSTTTTASVPATTWQPPPTSRPDSGVGAPPTSTIVTPTTVAPPATVPATSAPPTTRVSY